MCISRKSFQRKKISLGSGGSRKNVTKLFHAKTARWDPQFKESFLFKKPKSEIFSPKTGGHPNPCSLQRSSAKSAGFWQNFLNDHRHSPVLKKLTSFLEFFSDALKRTFPG